MGKSASAPSNTGNVGHSSAATGVLRKRCAGGVEAVGHRCAGVKAAAVTASSVGRVVGRIARGMLGLSRPWQYKEVQKWPHAYEFGSAAALGREKDALAAC